MARPQLRAVDGNQAEESSRVVQPELNLEQWPLFIPSQARREKHKIRILEHCERLPNGDTRTYSVEIEPSVKFGTLTAKDQRVLYALFLNWKEKGSPLGYCYYSTYRLARILKANTSGASIDSILESLRRLHAVTLRFKSCFHDAETGNVYEDEEPIHILSELKIKNRRRLDSGKYETTKSEGYVSFHTRILKNLIRQYTRPILFDVVLSLESDTAQLIYALVDRNLSTFPKYNPTTKTLFNELGLDGKDYRYKSVRMRELKRPLMQIEGKPLSSGGFLQISTIETKDKSDYVIVFTKKKTEAIAALPKADSQEPQLKKEPSSPENAGKKSLVERLYVAGVTETVARELAKNDAAECERQLEALPHRKGIEDAGAYLVRAIRDRYSLPAKVEAKQVKEKAAKKREAVEQKRAEQVAQLQPAYESYVRERLFTIEQEHRGEFEAFQQSEAKKRRFFEKGNTARSLEAFESEESRLGRAILFFLNNRECPILGFDEWEKSVNQ